MKNTTEKFHNKYNTHCYCVVTVICTNVIFYKIPEEAETLRITLPLGHLLKIEQIFGVYKEKTFADQICTCK